MTRPVERRQQILPLQKSSRPGWADICLDCPQVTAQEREDDSSHPKISSTPEMLPFHRKLARHNSVPPGGNICAINTAVDTSDCSMKGFKQMPIRKNSSGHNILLRLELKKCHGKLKAVTEGDRQWKTTDQLNLGRQIGSSP